MELAKGAAWRALRSTRPCATLAARSLRCLLFAPFRVSHAAVAMGSDIYVLGGLSRGDTITAEVIKYDSIQGMWTETAPMPRNRFSFASCALGADIYVFGGQYVGEDTASVFKLDTVSGEWITLAPMPRAHASPSAIVLDGMVYILGSEAHQFVMRFDPATELWSTLASNLNNRRYRSLFVIRGCLHVAPPGVDSTLSVECYDMVSDTWTALARMLDGRSSLRAVTIGYTGPVEEQDLFDALITKASSRCP